MTDFRALCAELLYALESERYAHWVNGPVENDLCLRARAALAQPEPEGPSIEDVEELCEERCFNVEGYESIECLQGLINEAIARWGHQPAPPADGEMAECAALADGPAVPDGREPASVDTSLALRVQQLEAMRETEKAALLDAFQQIDRLKIDRLKALIDWQYTKIHRLELAIAAELEGAQ